MIRHSSSFFISLAFHALLFTVIIYAYENVTLFEKNDIDKKVSVKLCCMVEQKPAPVVQVKPKPKVIPPKSLKKIEPKKPKPKPKKVEVLKEMPVVVPIVEEEIVEVLEEVEKTQEPKPIIEEVVEAQTAIVQVEVEDPYSKELRLEQEYFDEHIKQIVELLRDNLYYPRSARKRAITGEVMVKFRLSRDATVDSIEVISSKSDILSRAAIKTIKDLSGNFPKPREELTLRVPIAYSLK